MDRQQKRAPRFTSFPRGFVSVQIITPTSRYTAFCYWSEFEAAKAEMKGGNEEDRDGQGLAYLSRTVNIAGSGAGTWKRNKVDLRTGF